MSQNAKRFENPDYLGDGVYVGHDSYQVWVWTSNGVDESAPIALEAPVLEALVRYARRIGMGISP